MIKHNVYNMLPPRDGKGAPLYLASAGVTGTFSSASVHNEYATSGKMFIEISGFHVAAGGLDTGASVTLYESFNNYSWVKNSDIVTTATSVASSYAVSNLGPYLKVGYTTYRSDIDNCRFRLDLYEEDI